MSFVLNSHTKRVTQPVLLVASFDTTTRSSTPTTGCFRTFGRKLPPDHTSCLLLPFPIPLNWSLSVQPNAKPT